MTKDIVSAEVFGYLFLFETAAFILTGIIGMVTNIINLSAFWKIGLRDSVTASFFYLSLTDFAVSAVVVIHGIFTTMMEMEASFGRIFDIQPLAMSFFCAKVRDMLYILSVWTTTFLAIQRCLCVYMPLHVKSLFSLTKTVIVLGAFAGYTLVTYIPVFAALGMVKQHDPSVNRTRPVMSFAPLKNLVWAFEEAQNSIIFPLVTQIIVLGSLVVMTSSLHAASRFRQTSNVTALDTRQRKAQKLQEDPETPGQARTGGFYTRHSTGYGHTQNLKGKDVKVVKAVILVSVVFVVCNTPKIITGLTRRIVPSFDVKRHFEKAYIIVTCAREEVEQINAAVNILIYYKLNSKFRQILRVGCKVK